MAVNHVRRNEQPAALDRSGYHFDDIGGPGAASQPSLRRSIAQVEMHPDEIRAARRGVHLYKIVERVPQPTAERKGEQRTTVINVLQAVPNVLAPYNLIFSAFSCLSSPSGIELGGTRSGRKLPECVRQSSRLTMLETGLLTLPHFRPSLRFDEGKRSAVCRHGPPENYATIGGFSRQWLWVERTISPVAASQLLPPDHQNGRSCRNRCICLRSLRSRSANPRSCHPSTMPAARAKGTASLEACKSISNSCATLMSFA